MLLWQEDKELGKRERENVSPHFHRVQRGFQTTRCLPDTSGAAIRGGGREAEECARRSSSVVRAESFSSLLAPRTQPEQECQETARATGWEWTDLVCLHMQGTLQKCLEISGREFTKSGDPILTSGTKSRGNEPHTKAFWASVSARSGGMQKYQTWTALDPAFTLKAEGMHKQP